MSNDDVLKKVVAGFMAIRKSPFRSYVGPASPEQVPAAFASGANETLPAPPVADYERAAAVAQVQQIETMMGPVKERFAGEEKLIATLTKLVETLYKLIETAPLAKQEPVKEAPAPNRRRFIRVVDPEVKATFVDANGLDGMLLDATRRVTIGKKYGAH